MDLSKLQEHLTEPIAPKYRYLTVPAMIGGYAANLVGAGAGAPIQGEVGTTGVSTIRFQADNDTHVFCPVFLPDDVDVEREIDFRLFWSTDQADADTVTFDILYAELTVNSSTIIAGATALSTAIGSDDNNGASTLNATGWGKLDAGTLTGTAKDGYYLSLTAKLTSEGDATSATDVLLVHGIQLRYRPKEV